MPIAKTFAFHHPSDDSRAAITRLRREYSALLETIVELCPLARERAVALTELEGSAMWAIKAVVANDPASVADVEG